MKPIHFKIRSGKHGSTLDHLAYITRQGCYAARGDLVATGYGNMPEWAKDQPILLWKASDKYERKNGSTYRSYTVSLPNVLTIHQLVELAWEQARQLAGPKPFQFAVHIPLSSLEGVANPHVHIVICDRTPDGIDRSPELMFRRHNPDNPERGGRKKDSGGKNPLELRDQVRSQRKMMAELTNTALERHGHSIRVDHRSLKEQGKQRTPERYLGPARIKSMSVEDKATHIAKRRNDSQVMISEHAT